MRGKPLNGLLVALLILGSIGMALASVRPPPEGGVLPDMEFSVPENPEH